MKGGGYTMRLLRQIENRLLLIGSSLSLNLHTEWEAGVRIQSSGESVNRSHRQSWLRHCEGGWINEDVQSYSSALTASLQGSGRPNCHTTEPWCCTSGRFSVSPKPTSSRVRLHSLVLAAGVYLLCQAWKERTRDAFHERARKEKSNAESRHEVAPGAILLE